MLVAIVGTGRNGSTLLARLLDGSPDLWMHPVELNYLSAFSDLLRYGRVGRLTKLGAFSRPLKLAGEVETARLLATFGGQLDELRTSYADKLVEPFEPRGDPLESLGRRGSYSAPAFLPALLRAASEAYGDGEEALQLAFKTIETPYVTDYVRTFPGLQIVHLVRHPVTSYASLKRTNSMRKGWPFWQHGGDELELFLERRWLPHARFLASGAAGDRLVVRYEDLCQRPEEVIGHVCSRLEIAPPAEPTLQTVLGGRRLSEDPVKPSQTGVEAPERVVSNMAAEFAYDEVVTPREREFIALRTHELARRLGYSDCEPTVSRSSLGRTWLLSDQWERRNADSRIRLVRALLRRRLYVFRNLLRP